MPALEMTHAGSSDIDKTHREEIILITESRSKRRPSVYCKSQGVLLDSMEPKQQTVMAEENH